MAMLPFDDRDGYIWYNGELMPWRDAKLHVLSHGLHYGSCVFEGERVYAGNIFKMTEHHERLHSSARALGFEIPYSVASIDEAAMAVCKANGIADGYVRPVAWRGSEMMGVSAQRTRINVAIAAWDWPAYFTPEARLQGIRMTVSPWRRPAPDTAPTKSKAAGLYMICTLSKHEAEGKGYNDALMLDYRGQIAEATGANIFLVQNGKLHTPTPDCFLDGITRRTVIALAKQMGYTVVERAILPEELAQTDEVFITGTAVEVTPVKEIDSYSFEVGEISRRLVGAYDALVQRPHDLAAAASASAA
jgi:branched-chain amino acid aminotransferase